VIFFPTDTEEVAWPPEIENELPCSPKLVSLGALLAVIALLIPKSFMEACFYSS
jgi:hypothetical protein